MKNDTTKLQTTFVSIEITFYFFYPRDFLRVYGKQNHNFRLNILKETIFFHDDFDIRDFRFSSIVQKFKCNGVELQSVYRYTTQNIFPLPLATLNFTCAYLYRAIDQKRNLNDKDRVFSTTKIMSSEYSDGSGCRVRN